MPMANVASGMGKLLLALAGIPGAIHSAVTKVCLRSHPRDLARIIAGSLVTDTGGCQAGQERSLGMAWAGREASRGSGQHLLCLEATQHSPPAPPPLHPLPRSREKPSPKAPKVPDLVGSGQAPASGTPAPGTPAPGSRGPSGGCAARRGRLRQGAAGPRAGAAQGAQRRPPGALPPRPEPAAGQSRDRQDRAPTAALPCFSRNPTFGSCRGTAQGRRGQHPSPTAGSNGEQWSPMAPCPHPSHYQVPALLLALLEEQMLLRGHSTSSRQRSAPWGHKAKAGEQS